MTEVNQSQVKRSSGGRGCCGPVLLGFLLGVGSVAVLLASITGHMPRFLNRTLGFGPGVAVLDVRGELTDERPILENLEELTENPDTRALVVRVDSPGGIVTVMEEVYAALVRVKREESIPVVASMGTVAASGGYFVCLAADRIYTNATSLTGSIGAAFEYYNAHELLNRVGVEHETIESGPFKSAGSFAEPMTDLQRELIQGVVDDIEEIFVDVVQESRDLSPHEVAAVADGRVFTGRQAVALGLADEIGDLHEAVEYAARQAGLGEDFRVIRIPRETHIQFRWLDWLGSFGTGYSPLGGVPKYVLR